MVRGINKVTLLGNVAAEPDFRVLANGSNSVATCGLATNESFKDANGQMQEQTEWHRLVFWGRTAEIARDYIHKGSLILVEGKLKTRSYEDQSGAKKYSTEIHVSDLRLLSPKADSAPQGGDQWAGQQPQGQWGGQPQQPGWVQQAPAQQPQQWGGQPQQQYQQAPAAAPQQYGYQPAFRSAPPAGAVPVGPAQPQQSAPQPQVASPAAFQAPQAQAPAATDGSRPFSDDNLPF